VDTNCIKLTSYLADRRRTADAFAGDALLAEYADRGLAASILLRAAEGTGLRRHLRTDASLSLAEDLPVTVTAVGTRPAIEAVLDRTLELSRPGLVTLGPARLLRGEIGPGDAADITGGALELTVYFSRQDRVYGVPAFEAMCELLQRRGFEGATALLGLDGATRGHRQRAQFFGRGGDVPMMVVAVGDAGLVGPVVPELAGLLRHPVMTLARVRVCKRDGRLISRPDEGPPGEDASVRQPGTVLWRKLTVYTAEAGQPGQPPHRAIVRRLRSTGTSGATVHRGVWGFHGDEVPHGDRLLQWGHHVPVITTVLDTADNVTAAFGIIDELTAEQGLVTSEDVLVLRDVATVR
jgi:PII-like signaling protein